MGPRDSTGARRRASLAIASARRALPVWEDAHPDRDDPHHAIGQAEDILAGHGDREAATRTAADLYTLGEDLIDEGGAEPPAWAAWAAHRAVHVALDDELFDPAAVDPTLEDLGTPPTRLDAAAFAAAAIAGGFPWVDGTDATARERFWLWWVEEARRAVARYGATG
jgi:hypothetical protein